MMSNVTDLSEYRKGRPQMWRDKQGNIRYTTTHIERREYDIEYDLRTDRLLHALDPRNFTSLHDINVAFTEYFGLEKNDE